MMASVSTGVEVRRGRRACSPGRYPVTEFLPTDRPENALRFPPRMEAARARDLSAEPAG